MGLFHFLKKKHSSDQARDRLKLLLVSDRADCSPEILEMIRRDPRVTIAHMAESLAEPKSSVINALNRLKEDGTVERAGGSRGYWRIRRCRNQR